MKILIAEDDFASRKYLSEVFLGYGICDLTVDGIEALDAYIMALDEGEPYDLICLDIMMPKVDGLKALKAIRQIEEERGIEEENRAKIIMITALTDTNNIHHAFETGCEAYIAKPIDTDKLMELMKKLRVIS